MTMPIALHNAIVRKPGPESIVSLPVSQSQGEALPPLSKEPLRLAERFLIETHRAGDTLTLRRFAGQWFAHTGICYESVPDEALRANLWTFLDRNDITPRKNLVSEIAEALTACGTLLEGDLPRWIGGTGWPDPRNIIGLKNGLLVASNRELIPPTAEYFSTNAAPLSYDAEAPSPVEWFRFLDSIWPGDRESVELLQEWIGYCLTSDTSLQKILLMVGPTRSGKGTIVHVAEQLIGPHNVCGPTLFSLGSNFGLEPLLGKTLAVISDARLSGRTDAGIVTERLLSISGEDTLTVDRKYLSPITGKVKTRLMLCTNELPRLADSSGALAGRFLILTMRKSFFGQEDHGLKERLMRELPSILLWALDGLERLRDRGHFQTPTASEEIIQEMSDLSSPIKAFLRERCEIKTGKEIPCETLFNLWKGWCAENGREHPGTVQQFGRDIRAAIPGVEIVRPREEGNQIRKYSGVGVKVRFQGERDFETH